MEEQKKSRKPLLVGVIAAVVVLAALLALLLTQCVGGQGPDSTSGAETTAPTAESYTLYWNVNRHDFEPVDGESTTGRKPAEDGFYHVVFAVDGKQVELRVKERRTVNIIDAYDIMSLVFDENGDVIDVIRLDDLPIQKMTWQYYIQSFGGNAVKLNSSKDMNGMEEMIKTNDKTVIYDVSGWSEFIGAPGKLQKEDRAYVIANMAGEVTHIFLYERVGIETSFRAECKHCGEEVTWKNWLKTDSLPIQTGHYFLENPVEAKGQSQIQNDAQICLDLNGQTVHSAKVARIYSTFYAGSSLAVMDNSDGEPGKFVSEGQNMDQGCCLWARYGNIDIYDITIDGSGATSHAGGTAVAVEGKSKMTLHSGTLIGGKTVEVKGKGNARNGATVLVSNGYFVMEDGLITGGTAAKGGGAVSLRGSGSTFTMNGGKITNGRTNDSNGGNVYIAANNEFIMNAGTISGGRAYKGEKATNGAGGNVVVYGTFTMNGGTITDGRCYSYDGKRVDTDIRQNVFIVNGKLYMNGGKITGSVQAVDTNVNDKNPCIVSVTGSARITGAKEGTRNLTLNGGVVFQAGRLSGKADIRVYASGIFSDKTRESNAKYVHSDVPNAEVVYYDGRLAIGRLQCMCGASVTEGKAHATVCDQKLELFGAYTTDCSKTVSGNFYLTTDYENITQLSWGTATKTVDGVKIVADPITINLDLNGHKISAKNRSMLIMPNVTMNISDSVGGGYVEGKGVTLPYTNGGVLLTQAGSVVNVVGATLKASDEMVETMKTGGVIQTAGTVNLYDATIIGNKLPAVNIKDDVRSQGASAGAAIYIPSGGVVNMYGTTTVTGGETVGNQAHGGNVYIAGKGVLNMYDQSKIVDGKASPDNKGGGGNVYIASGGFMHMYDNASVTDGKADPVSQTNSQDIFAVGGKLYVHGGHAGIVALTSMNGTAADMTVGTNAKVDRVHRGIWNSATAKNPSTELPLIIIEGVLTDDAKIVMNNGNSLFTNETVPENADNFVHNDGKTPITYHEETKKLCIGKYSKPAATLYHCVCGMQSAESLDGTVTSKGECFGGCDGTIVEWKPWTGKTLPNQSGYWVITGGEYGTTTIGEWKNVAGTEADPSVTIFVDLNGGEVSVAKNSRAYAFGTMSEVNLTIMDSVGGGAIVSRESTNADQALLVWNRSAKKINFNLYGGTLDASAATTTADSEYGGQGAVQLGANAAINLYGGTVKGQNVVKGNKDKETGEITSYSGKGGAFYLASGTVMTMSGDAKVIGGEVGECGDAIYMAADVTLTLKDNASIVNKDADKNSKAGNVYAEGGCTIGVADSVKVDNLIMKSGTYIEVDGILADDAKIVLNGVTGTFTKKTVAENADKFVSLDEKEIFFSEEASVLYIDKYVKPYNAFHCVCGMQYTDPDTGAAASKGECIGDCSGEIVEWKAWTGKTLPNRSGYWYVNGGTYGQAIFPIDKDTEIYIDLAGNEIGTDFRAFQFKGSGKENVVLKQTLTITDSVGGARLAVDFANADEHSAIAMLNKNNNKKDENGNKVKDDKGKDVLLENALPIVTFNIYGGHLDASAVAEGAGVATGAVNLGANATINMFGGKVTGQNAMSTSEKTFAKVNDLENVKYTIRSGSGGAFYLDSGTKMYMYNDAEIVGGTVATRGGSVFMNTGAQLYMYDNSIIRDGKIEVTGDNVVNNTDTHGGNVFVSSSAVLSLNDNAMIVGGKAINECQKISPTGVPSKVSSQGGNIYANGTVEVNDNAQIKDGTSVSNANTSDVFLVGAAAHLKISGYVGKTTAASTAGKITVSGSAKADLLRLATGWKIDVVGTLADDAKIIVDNTVGAFTTETVAENADNFESKDGKEVWFVESDKVLCIDKYSKPATILYHCICGMQSAKSLDGTVTSKGECFGGCDGKIIEWTPWTGTTMPNKAGYWVMSGGSYTTAYVTTAGDIYVDLNGATINVAGNNRGWRFQGNLDGYLMKLTITDAVGGGTIKSSAYKNGDHSVLVWAYRPNNADLNGDGKKDATKVTVDLEIYGGHLDASAHESTGTYGTNGAIELGANAIINMYGGKISGCTVGKPTITNGVTTAITGVGGAIKLSSGSILSMSGNAEIVGSKVSENGGAVYMGSGSTVNMTDNAKITGGEVTGSPAKDTHTHGGNLYIASGATLNMSGNASISGGKAHNPTDGKSAQGGNIYANGIINISENASITGGACDAATNATTYTETADNADIFLEDATSELNMNGGKVGRMHVAGGVGSITLAGAAKINHLRYTAGWTVAIDGVLPDEAEIFVANVSGVISKKTVAENADNFTSVEGKEVWFVEEAEVLCIDRYVPIVEYNKYHCVCGNYYVKDNNTVRKAPCVEGCPGAIEEWKPWTGTFTKDAENYFYFDTSRDVSQIIVKGDTTIYFDLAGKTLNSASRGFNLTGASGATNKQTIGFTDTVGGGVWNFNLNDSHSSIVMNHANGGTVEGTFKLFSGHLNAATAVAPTATQSNGAVSIGNNGKVYILGGTLTGSKYVGNDANAPVLTKTGGAINLGTGSTLYIGGGAVINGGNVTQMGGAIYAPTGCNITIEDGATINGGRAPEGAAIYSLSNVTINNATINGGVAIRDTANNKGGRGGAFYVAGGTLTIDNSVVNGGYVDELSPNDEGDVYGGGAIFANAGDVVIKNGSQIVGYDSADSNIRRGGTVYAIGSANITLDNSTITGSKVVVNGAAVHFASSGTFTMKGEDAAITLDKTKIKDMNYGACFSMGSGTFDMQDGTITGTNVVNTIGGGAVYVYGGTFKMSGGIITGGESVAKADSKNYGGGLTVTKKATVELSGDAKITRNVGGNIYLYEGAKLTVGTLVADDPATTDVNEGAQFGISMQKPGVFTTNAVASTAGFVSDVATLNLVQNGDGTLSLVDPNGSTEPEGTTDGTTETTTPEDTTPDAPAGEYKAFHCICGNHYADDLNGTNEGRKADCFGDCKGTIVEWKEWTGTTLPTQTGNYYITENNKEINCAYVRAAADIKVDLNGKTLKLTERAYRFDSAAEVYAAKLTITDTVGTGKMVSNPGNTDHSRVLWLYHNNNKNTLATVTFDMYGGHIDASGLVGSGQFGAIVLGPNANINMYGGMITGMENTHGSAMGGAIYLDAGSTMTMSGKAEVVGVKSRQGAAIYMTAGTSLTMSDDATITGGTATLNAGAVYMAKGVSADEKTTLIMNDKATITGGYVDGTAGTSGDSHGGNIFAPSNTYIVMNHNASITNGKAINTNTYMDGATTKHRSAQGGNIYTNGILELNDNATITGGACDSSNETAPNANSNNADLFIVTATSVLDMNGGHIGRVASGDTAGQIKVAGKAQIDFLRLAANWMITIDGTLADEAMIAVNNRIGVVTGETVEANANNIVSADGYKVVYDATSKKISIDNSEGVKHCLCGASTTGGQHALGCDGTVLTWNALSLSSTGSVTLNQSGNYYLTGNITNRTSQIAVKAAEGSGVNVNIDLNGYNITSTYRVFQVWFDSSLTITNTTCNPGNNRPENGAVIYGSNCADGNGALQATNSGGAKTDWETKLTVMNGVTVKASRAEAAQKNAGVIGIGSYALVKLYNVTVIDETNYTQDGAITVGANATLNVVDSVINGGNGHRNGGAILSSGNLNIKGNTVINGSAVTGNGGAIYVNAGKTVISENAVINAGTATNGNGIYLNNGELKLNGGTIEGEVYVNNGKLTVSGDVNVIGNETSGKGIVLPYVEGSKDAVLNVGEMGENASVLVNKVIDTKVIARPDSITDEAWQAYRNSTAKLVIEDGLTFSFEADGIYLRDAEDDAGNAIVYHCLCGAKGGETHLGECTGYDVAWKAWTKNNLPNTNGHWYLTKADFTYTAAYIGDFNGTASTEAPNFDIYVDLNGLTSYVVKNDRAFVMGASNVCSLTITDSVGGGKIVNEATTNSDQALLVWDRAVLNPVFKMYGGTLDASAVTNAGSHGGMGAFHMKENAVIDIYGGVIKGMNVRFDDPATAAVEFKGAGGAFYLSSDSVMTISGNAEIYGANVYYHAGAIYLGGNASVTMSGNAKIIGGATEANNGGSVFIANDATLTLKDNASITNGSAPNNQGGNVYVNGTLIVEDNASIVDGSCVGTNPQSADVFAVHGHVEVKDNAHLGLVNVYAYGGAASIKASDSPVIDQLHIGKGTDQEMPYLQIEGVLGDASKIYFRTTGVVTTATDAQNVDNIKSRYGYAVSQEADGTVKIEVVTDAHARHCFCGASVSGAQHVKDCDGTVLTWVKYTGQKVSGNYYLTKNEAFGSQLSLDGEDGAPIAINLDLNGWNITAASSRVFQLYDNVTLSVTNTRSNPNVGFNKLAVVAGNGYADGAWVTVQMIKAANSTLNIWPGVSFESIRAEYADSASIICIEGGGTVNMYGGQISGGLSARGSAVRVNNGTLKMYNDALITNGRSYGHGGNVYIQTGSTLKMYDNAKILNGTALNPQGGDSDDFASYGGNVALYGTLEMNGNAKIIDGQAKIFRTDTVATKDSGHADIFAVHGFTLTMNGGHIGRISYGGSNAPTYNFSGKITIDYFTNFKHAANITAALDPASKIHVNSTNTTIKLVNAGTWTPEQLAQFATCFKGNSNTVGAALADGIYLQAAQ